MSIIANSHRPHSHAQDLESSQSGSKVDNKKSVNSNDVASNWFESLGSELVFVQQGDGRYLTYSWQCGESFGLSQEKVVGKDLCDQTFIPMDVGS